MRRTRFAGFALVAVAACSSDQPASRQLPPWPAHTLFSAPARAISEGDIEQIALPHPGVRRIRHQDIEALEIRADAGTALVAVSGGHLLSFVPRGQDDALWLSPKTALPPQPIRGGVPVLWPYFARQGQHQDLPSHGLVRTQPWQLLQAQRHDDGSVTVVMAPTMPAVEPLQLRMVLHVGGSLEQTLVTRNLGTQAVHFTQALHNYFRVGDVRKVQVEGLDGAAYRNKRDGFATAWPQHGPWSLDDASAQAGVDRIYAHVRGSYTLVDPLLRRKIRLTTEGSKSLVLWNPGFPAERRLPDVAAGWRHYLCLEAANAGEDVVEVPAGGERRLSQRIEVLPLD